MQLSLPSPPTPDSLGPYVAPGSPHLEEVGRQHAVPVAVVEGERGGEAGHGDAVLDARAHRFPPRVLDRERHTSGSQSPTNTGTLQWERQVPAASVQTGRRTQNTCDASIRSNVEKNDRLSVPKSEMVNPSIWEPIIIWHIPSRWRLVSTL